MTCAASAGSEAATESDGDAKGVGVEGAGAEVARAEVVGAEVAGAEAAYA